jgi:hypothetical protein
LATENIVALIIIRFSNVVVAVAFRFGVTIFAQQLKQFSIEVDAGIKENIALAMPLRIGYSVSCLATSEFSNFCSREIYFEKSISQI